MYYRSDIDGLRGVAVASVVAHHLHPPALPGGFVGVDIFFVISGYLITTIILREREDGSFSLGMFYLRRARRLLPALLAMILGTLGFGYAYLYPADYTRLAVDALASLLFVANFRFWSETGYFDSEASLKPLLNLWSLGIEEQFYLFWPLLLVNTPKKYLIGSICTIAAISLGLSAFWPATPGSLYFLPQFRIWELATGGMCACLLVSSSVRSILSERLSVLFSATGLVLIVSSAALLDPSVRFPGYVAIVPVLGAALVILAAPDNRISRNTLSLSPLVLLGLISYPLYLWHWPLLALTRLASISPISLAERGFLVFVAVLLAAATYLFIERPIRQSKQSLKAIGIPIGVFATTVAAACVGLLIGKGLPGRFPSIEAQVSAFSYDYTSDWRFKTCFLPPEGGPEAFDSICYGAKQNRKPFALLWGDSHAAQLYPGLVEFGTFEVVQLTASACAPLPGIYHEKAAPNCPQIQTHIRDWITKAAPDTVILAGVWANHDWRKLGETLDFLKTSKVKAVWVVGQVPRWVDTLPRQILTHLRTLPEGARVELPKRLATGLVPGIKELDQQMREFVTGRGAKYISALDILCNPRGCTAALDASPSTIITYDESHLTKTGSHYLVRNFPDEFMSRAQ